MKKHYGLSQNEWPNFEPQLIAAPLDIDIDQAMNLKTLKGQSLRNVKKSYGLFLSYLHEFHPGLINESVAKRVTKDVVKAYKHFLQESHVHSSSAASYLQDLLSACRRLEPDNDWTFLKVIAKKTRSRATNKKSKAKVTFPAQTLFKVAMSAMEEAFPKLDKSHRARLQFRNGLILSVWISCPLRISDFKTLTLGTSFVEREGRYRIEIPAMEKTKHPISYPIPELLTDYIEFYLENVRPRYSSPDISNLWVSERSKVLGQCGIRNALENLTEKYLGQRVYPQGIRYSAASSSAISGKDRMMAPSVLGHKRPETTENYYNQANQLSAQSEHVDVIRELLRKR